MTFPNLPPPPTDLGGVLKYLRQVDSLLRAMNMPGRADLAAALGKTPSGSDEDLDLIRVDVSGTPTFSWDESENAWRFNTPVLAANPLLHVEDQKNSGTNGGGFTSGAWRTRDLNTVAINTVPGAGVSSNQITLPAGTYWVRGSAPAFAVDQHKTRLQDTTVGKTLVLGSNEFTRNSAANTQTRSHFMGQIRLSQNTTLEVQHRCSTSQGSNGFGTQAGYGQDEVYTQCWIVKVDR